MPRSQRLLVLNRNGLAAKPRDHLLLAISFDFFHLFIVYHHFSSNLSYHLVYLYNRITMSKDELRTTAMTPSSWESEFLSAGAKSVYPLGCLICHAIFCVYLIFSATSLALQAFVSDVEQVENLSGRRGLRVSVSLRCYVESERLCLIVLVSTCTCAVLGN